MTDQAATPEPMDVPIRDESIRLGQFLKLANLIDNGSEAKPLLASERVRVNEVIETRRGRQLKVGDVVSLEGLEDGSGQAVRVSTGDIADDLPW